MMQVMFQQETVMRVGKFLTTGALGLTINLSSYRLLVEYFGAHYLPGSMLALSLSTVVAFFLQKYWTFEERSRKRMSTQFVLYVSLALFNLSLNTALVYLLTGLLGIHYLVSQAVGAGTISIFSFFMYRFIIFARSAGEESSDVL